MTHAERIPLKMNGLDVGSARVNVDGTISLTMKAGCQPGLELLEFIRSNVVVGLSIKTIINPVVDGEIISRLDHEMPLADYEGFKFNHRNNQGKSY